MNLKTKQESYWDWLSYEIRKIIYSYNRSPEEENVDYKDVMKSVFYDIWVYSWLRWTKRFKHPVKIAIIERIFKHCWPYRFEFMLCKHYEWKVPDQTRFEILIYKLGDSKTGVTVKKDGTKIYRGYVRTYEQYMKIALNTNNQYLADWLNTEKEKSESFHQKYYYAKSTDLYIKDRKYMYSLMYF